MNRANGTIVVTGGLGFIGKNFCDKLSLNFERKIIVDKITYASDLEFYDTDLEKKGWEHFAIDINSEEFQNLLMPLNHCIVVHFAAESHVDNSFENAKEFVISNTLGTQSVIDIVRSKDCKLLHVSTDEVYGESIVDFLDEGAVFNPTNPYAATKAAADILVQTHIRCFGLNAKIIRANNIYGPRQLAEKVIPKAIKYASEKRKFSLHGGDEITRHFLHTEDFTRACETLLENWFDIDEIAFNVASADEITIRNLVEFIYTEIGCETDLISIGPDRPFNDRGYKINDKLIRSKGWKQRKTLVSELKKLCRARSYLDVE